MLFKPCLELLISSTICCVPYSSKEASWIRATELLVQVASHGETNGYEVPCLIVAAKDDLEPYPNAIEALTGVYIFVFQLV